MIKKSYRKCLILVLTFLSYNAFAQSDEAAIKQTINNMFDGMRKTDTTLIRAAFTNESILQTVVKSKEAVTSVRTEKLESFLESISKPHKEIYNEKIRFDLIKIDGDLALVWTPYKFYLGDKFHHCGVNSFHLIKQNGKWKIVYLIDTRRKEECDNEVI